MTVGIAVYCIIVFLLIHGSLEEHLNDKIPLKN